MSLAQALAAQVVKPVRVCTVALLLEQLEPEDAAALQKALDLPQSEKPTAEIHSALLSEGYRLAASTLGNHRFGRCCCGTR